jgi:uncharacterized protein YjiS (DUF1127 family)
MEAAMNISYALTSHQAARPRTPGLAKVSRRPLAIPRSTIAIWRERIRLRWELAEMARDNPHLIDDIGLTRQQVEAEIAKPFWRG